MDHGKPSRSNYRLSAALSGAALLTSLGQSLGVGTPPPKPVMPNQQEPAITQPAQAERRLPEEEDLSPLVEAEERRRRTDRETSILPEQTTSQPFVPPPPKRPVVLQPDRDQGSLVPAERSAAAHPRPPEHRDTTPIRSER